MAEKISGILQDIIKKLEKKKSSKKGQIFTHWKDFVGDSIAAHITPERIHRKKLFVSVDSSVWVFDFLQNQKKEILKKIQESLGEDKISDIVAHVK